MGVYIKGMEMPKRGHTVTLTIMGGGEAVVQYYDCKPQLTVPIVYDASTVPEHGRLIDADAYEKLLYGLGNRDYRRKEGGIKDAIKFLNPYYTPTIIPADKESEG